ncbi:hypothetical protein FN846DRAFT_912008 [Sphaerosporella brunnea]|uniref:Protein kinase domain-containing protein n=1 Tax=Sphaerosporella brunnea TaxID=1250544 RepID=A0A5J5EJ64_9PEZI|nr:hypothetical protein FN846DRAFT_912008 [Sphaerosporella brunnea]
MVNAARLGDKIPGIELIDTHARKDLLPDTCSPDLVISPAGQRKALAHALYGIIELEICDHDELETATHLGLALVAKYCAVDLGTLILYLRHTLALQTGVSDFMPPPLFFSLPSSDLTRRSSERNVFAAFTFNDKVIAVKYTTEAFKVGIVLSDEVERIAHQIQILRRIKSTPGRPLSLPGLEYAFPNDREFGMTPVGQPFTLASLPSVTAMQEMQWDTLSGLEWLHRIGIIHLDLRRNNVSGKPKEVNHHGGLHRICNPEFDITTDTYVPLPLQDLQRWALLVLQCLFPSRFKGLQSHRIKEQLKERIREERKDLANPWGQLKASAVWSRFVAEVIDRDDVACELLEQMAQVYLFPTRVAR